MDELIKQLEALGLTVTYDFNYDTFLEPEKAGVKGTLTFEISGDPSQFLKTATTSPGGKLGSHVSTLKGK